MKTSELTGAALDWAVAICEGRNLDMRHNYIKRKAVENNYTDVEGLAFQLSTQVNEIIDSDTVNSLSATAMNSTLELKTIAYSSDWALGGPIIQHEKISLSSPRGFGWVAELWQEKINPITGHFTFSSGDTPLIAAMRCYVASKLGGEIEIPKELT